jgi:glycosyltransferase involved in cell wall biosynthesis
LRAIKCFQGQTYINKELIILFQNDDEDTLKILDSIDDTSISTIRVKFSSNLSLGFKRNLLIEISKGEYFCTWDDDDWYHKKRLEIQMDAILQSYKDACILLNIILFDSIRNQAYMSFPWTWEGSLLCRKTTLKDNKYSNVNKGEDSYLIKNLLSQNCIFPVIKPTLYIYVYNGKNTSNSHQFKSFFFRSQKLSNNFNFHIKKILEGKYSYEKASNLLLGENLLHDINYLQWAKKIMDKLVKNDSFR